MDTETRLNTMQWLEGVDYITSARAALQREAAPENAFLDDLLRYLVLGVEQAVKAVLTFRHVEFPGADRPPTLYDAEGHVTLPAHFPQASEIPALFQRFPPEYQLESVWEQLQRLVTLSEDFCRGEDADARTGMLQAILDTADAIARWAKAEIEPLNWDEDLVNEALRRNAQDVLIHLVIWVSMNGDDWRYAQALCVRLSSHPNPVIRGDAMLGFGHIARVHHRLQRSIVQPVILSGLQDPDDFVRGQAETAKDDTSLFLGWRYDR